MKEVQYAIWYLERHKAWITASKVPEIKAKKKIARNPSQKDASTCIKAIHHYFE